MKASVASLVFGLYSFSISKDEHDFDVLCPVSYPLSYLFLTL